MSTALTTIVILAASFDTSVEAPPGSDGVSQIIRWVAWGVAIACLLGVLFGVAYLGSQNRRGETPQHLQGIIISMMCAGGVSLIGGIVGALAG